jgi:hypothetical protein
MCVDCKRHLGSHEGLPDSHLHKEAVFSVMMRAARCAGLKVRTEVPARWVSARSAMDCGWYSATGKLLVAFEFDGRDVSNDHIAGNVAKFAGCPAPIKVQILYSTCNDLTAKRNGRASEVARMVGPAVQVITDEQLMAGHLEELVAHARASAGTT